jgi:eukaryotic-like serine/threonine-protein kinase
MDHDNPPMADDVIAGRYRLLEPLGRGAMSSVWLAEDEELGRRVAVKRLAQHADRARFEREARAAAALSHPNICSLYDYGDAEGRPYMVLEYLPNGTLEDRLQGRALPDDETLRVATEVAAGLAHAHDRDLVHRDLKPTNIMFDAEDRAKIADFGIARMMGSGTLTEAGTVLGTASYISPEQASGDPAGPASDVYSFGVILFRMLTGRLPFVSTNAMELVRRHRDEAPPSVADFRSDAPPRLEAVVVAALAKDPAARPANGGALLRQLRGTEGAARALLAPDAFPSATAATQILRPPRQPPPRRRAYWLVPLAVLLLGGGVALALVTSEGTGGSDATTSAPLGLTLPHVSTAASTKPATTAASTTEQATTSTAAPTTTTAHTTTRPATTTHPVTVPTVPPTTTVALPPTTTIPPPTTTEPLPTTDTTPTTTVAITTTP